MPTKNVKIKLVFNELFHKLRSKDFDWNKDLNGIAELDLVAGKVFSIDIG